MSDRGWSEKWPASLNHMREIPSQVCWLFMCTSVAITLRAFWKDWVGVLFNLCFPSFEEILEVLWWLRWAGCPLLCTAVSALRSCMGDSNWGVHSITWTRGSEHMSVWFSLSSRMEDSGLTGETAKKLHLWGTHSWTYNYSINLLNANIFFLPSFPLGGSWQANNSS